MVENLKSGRNATFPPRSAILLVQTCALSRKRRRLDTNTKASHPLRSVKACRDFPAYPDAMSADQRERDPQSMAVFLLTKHSDDAVKIASALKASALAFDDVARAQYWDQVLTVISASRH